MMNLQRARTAIMHVERGREVLQCVRELESWPRLIPAYVGLASLRMPFTARTRGGEVFTLEEFYDAETLWQIYCRGIYEVSPDDRLIVDAGANIGLFACYAATRAPQAIVHAIEPFPSTFDRLVSTIRENHLEKRVRCHQCALDATSGVGAMSASAEASQMFRLVAPADGAAAVTVPTTTLGEFVRALGADTIDMLKMDIEGSEYKVLLSASADVLRRFRRVTVEFHEPPSDTFSKHALSAHLREAGFGLREDPEAAGNYGIFHFAR